MSVKDEEDVLESTEVKSIEELLQHSNELQRRLVERVEVLESQASPRRIIRDPELLEYCGLKRSQRDHLIAKGEFPAPIRLAGQGGRAKGWLADEIAAWQRERIAERDKARLKRMGAVDAR